MTFPSRNPGGSGVYAIELLSELDRREDVDVMTVAAPPQRGFAGTMRWLTLGAHASVTGSQLVHCPSFVAPWRLAVPLVLTIHDTSTEKYPEDQHLEWRAYTRFLLPERARAATRVITGTEHSRREIVQVLGVPEDRVAVTPYGVADRFAVPPGGRSADVSPSPQLLFPGAPIRRKNLDVVLEGMARAPEGTALSRARLVISGAGAGRFPRHSDQISSLGLHARVDWRGNVPAEAMPALIQASDLVVYPSFHEGFGFPALEAMAAGTPVLSSNAACLPEVLGNAAVLIEPSNASAFVAAAEALLTDAGLRREMVARGRARAAMYTWKRCAELTTEVYREALATASTAGPRGRGSWPRG